MTIIEYIAADNPDAAQRLKEDIEVKCAALPLNPQIYRSGRITGTREMVVRSNYVVIYSEADDVIQILRVLHGAQQWPPESQA